MGSEMCIRDSVGTYSTNAHALRSSNVRAPKGLTAQCTPTWGLKAPTCTPEGLTAPTCTPEPASIGELAPRCSDNRRSVSQGQQRQGAQSHTDGLAGDTGATAPRPTQDSRCNSTSAHTGQPAQKCPVLPKFTENLQWPSHATAPSRAQDSQHRRDQSCTRFPENSQGQPVQTAPSPTQERQHRSAQSWTKFTENLQGQRMPQHPAPYGTASTEVPSPGPSSQRTCRDGLCNGTQSHTGQPAP